MVVKNNFSFSRTIFKRPRMQARKTRACLGKGQNGIKKHFRKQKWKTSADVFAVPTDLTYKKLWFLLSDKVKSDFKLVQILLSSQHLNIVLTVFIIIDEIFN